MNQAETEDALSKDLVERVTQNMNTLSAHERLEVMKAFCPKCGAKFLYHKGRKETCYHNPSD